MQSFPLISVLPLVLLLSAHIYGHVQSIPRDDASGHRRVPYSADALPETYEDYYRYSVKSAIIEYLDSASNEQSTYYFDSYGEREAMRGTVVYPGKTLKATSMMIADGDLLFKYDDHYKRAEEMFTSRAGRAMLGSIVPVWSLSEKERRRFQARRVESRTILDKTAEGWSYVQSHDDYHHIEMIVWVWKGIVLGGVTRATRNGAESVSSSTAQSLKLNVSIPNGTFQVPAGIQPLKSR